MILKFGLFSVLYFLAARAEAQQTDYLLYIDAENAQSFYARVGDRTISSSSAGHLVIPHLTDGDYDIVIGFPRTGYPEQRFNLRVSGKDQGLQLRNLGEKGWALFNWLTNDVRMNVNSKNDSTLWDPGRGVKRDDPFSRLMASVVNDSTVMYNTYIPEPEPKDSLAKQELNKMDTLNQLPAKLPVAIRSVPESGDSVKLSPEKAKKLLAAERTDSLMKIAAHRRFVKDSVAKQLAVERSDSLKVVQLRRHEKDSLARQLAVERSDSLKMAHRLRFVKDSTAKKLAAERSDSLKLAQRRHVIKDSATASLKGQTDSVQKSHKGALQDTPLVAHQDTAMVQPKKTRKQLLAARADSLKQARQLALNQTSSSDSLTKKNLAGTKAALAKADSGDTRAAINKSKFNYPYTKKLSEKALKTTVKMVFIDQGKDGRLDSIILFVPYEIAVIPKPISGDTAALLKSGPPEQTRSNLKTDSAVKRAQEMVKGPLAKDTSNADAPQIALRKNHKKGIPLADCRKVANDYDIGVLRVDILTANGLANKLAAARRYFHDECFTVEQIRLLGDLFATDQFRYQFYEASYPYITDRENFQKLAAQLADAVLLKKFKSIGQ